MIKAKELKIYVEATKDFKRKITEELRQVQSGKASGLAEDSVSFKSLNQVRKVLTPKRLELLSAIRHRKPGSIYELAKSLERTPENVNTDIKLLNRLGFVELARVKEVRNKVVPEVSYDKMTLEVKIQTQS